MTDIPRKLSVDDLSNPELAYWVQKVRVFLDGVEVKDCVKYDMDDGVMERYLLRDGKPVSDGEELVIEVVRGEITVELSDG